MVRAHSVRGLGNLRTVAILAGLIATFYLARAILIPLAFALTLTLILAPAVDYLVALRMKRALAALFIVSVALVAAGAVSVVIFNQVLAVLNELPAYQENIEAKLAAAQAPSNSALGRATQNLRKIAEELSSPPPVPAALQDAKKSHPVKRAPDPALPQAVRIVPPPANDLGDLGTVAKQFLRPLGDFGVVMIVTIFLLIEQNEVRDRLLRLAGLGRLYLVTRALDDATSRVSRYLRLQFSVNFIFGILFGAGLWLIGVPYAALWGAVAALFRLVPYVGSATAGVLAVLLSLAVFNDWTQPLLVIGLFLLLELVTANLLEPWLYGSQTGISSLMLLLCTVFWATLWGPAGLILSTPLTVCMVVLGRHVPQLSCLHILLGDEPALAAAAQLYQRLLAFDEAGARAVVNRNLEEGAVLPLYDTVIAPALVLVKRDRVCGELDAEREETILNSLRDIVGEVTPRLAAKDAAAVAEAAPKRAARGRIICLPNVGECDEVAAALLAQLIDAAGGVAVALPSGVRLPQMTRMLKPTAYDTFCISALPPGVFAKAHVLMANLQRRYPETPVVIGAWGFAGDSARALDRFQPARPKALVTTFADAVAMLVPVAPQEGEGAEAGVERSAELSGVRG
jgi:predicted PurR-regulated permease PerM